MKIINSLYNDYELGSSIGVSIRKESKFTNDSWRVDEIYLKVKALKSCCRFQREQH